MARVFWTDKRNAVLKGLVAEGFQTPKIHARLRQRKWDVTLKGVRLQVNKLGLHTPRSRQPVAT